MASAGADELLRLVRMLRFCDGFPAAHPDLVMALLARAWGQGDFKVGR